MIGDVKEVIVERKEALQPCTKQHPSDDPWFLFRMPASKSFAGNTAIAP